MSNEKITLFVSGLAAPFQRLTLSPELLYYHARQIIPRLLHLDGADKTALLIKVAVKGVFLMYGDKILEEIFKSKDHPRPGKTDDLVEWYIDMFTQILILQALKSTYTVEVNETSEIIGFSAQPVPAIAAPDHGGHDDGTKAE